MVIGLVAVGYLYVRIFHASVTRTRRLHSGLVFKPTLGGLLVGMLELLMLQALGSR
ncbi:chloride channel protein [Mycobacterium uberis]|uniref:chloride channel protein n=1 Tax=Mycobacterium uberis TaxID=2162698 RepID=UPI001FB3C505|nr:chloride channel protein [Mycobacterium uberis]